MQHRQKICLSLATDEERESIYAIRHQVYARELRQHPENTAERLTDGLDAFNTYVVAKRGAAIVGFVAITPPGVQQYSVEKYFRREEIPISFDEGLHEVRLLTVVRAYRNTQLAFLLMYGALRYLESRGARTIVAIGRIEILPFYLQVGLKSLALRACSGAVTYELLAADVGDLRARLATFDGVVDRLARMVDWCIDGVPLRSGGGCHHGGAFFDAIGDDFSTLEKKDHVINADVLDAWFDPAPAVVKKLAEYLPFALMTSPPTGSEGMRRVIAVTRGVPEESILPGAGSSDLIYGGLRHWVARGSRVLILDPMYGEYAHVLERVIGARVDRLVLSSASGYTLDPEALAACAARRYDWIVLVNPNSPTGRHLARAALQQIVAEAPPATRFWIDEAYLEYAGEDQSMEIVASESRTVVVCKSMSKVYALSGVRAAYLCGPAHMLTELRRLCPPWAVSLPGQIAACEALRSTDYYRRRWQETAVLRAELRGYLESLGWEVIPGCANCLLCRLPRTAPDAATLCRRTRERDLFIRQVADMGASLDARMVRIAVKDRRTNAMMLGILEAALARDTRLGYPA